MSNNVLSIIIGLAMIISCCSIAFFTQKKFFNKYKNKFTETTMEQRMQVEKNN